MAIAALHTESWRANYRGALSDDFLSGPIVEDRKALWEQRMSDPQPNEWMILAEDDSGLVGFACAIGDHDERLGTYLNNIHVRGTSQGDGVGKALLARVAQWSAERYPASGLYLGVLEQNARAQRFYQRHGASDAGGETWDPPGGGSAPVRTYTWSRSDLDALVLAAAGDTVERRRCA